MFQKLLEMYVDNRIDEKYLIKAVKLNWITQDDMDNMIEFKSLVKKESKEE